MIFLKQALSYLSPHRVKERQIFAPELSSITMPILVTSEKGIQVKFELTVHSLCPRSLERAYRLYPDDRKLSFGQLCQEAAAIIFGNVTSTPEAKKILCGMAIDNRMRAELDKQIHLLISNSDYVLETNRFPPVVQTRIGCYRIGSTHSHLHEEH